MNKSNQVFEVSYEKNKNTLLKPTKECLINGAHGYSFSQVNLFLEFITNGIFETWQADSKIPAEKLMC